MNQPHEDTRLSTAQMAAAGEQTAKDEDARARAAQTAQSQDPARRAPVVPNGGTSNATPAALFPADEVDNLRSRWTTVQGTFVDQPRQAVEQADTLVAELMKRLAETFAQERTKLEQQWSRGDNVSTEELRIALQRYRSFFDRLLSV